MNAEEQSNADALNARPSPPPGPSQTPLPDLKPYAVVHGLIPFSAQYAWLTHPFLNRFCVFYAGWYIKAQGHSWKRSNQNEGIYIYCTAGKGYYRCGGKRWTVGPGDLLYCFPFSAHSYGADENDPWTIHWMHIAGSEVTLYSSLLGFNNDRPVIHVGDRPRAIGAFQTIFHFLKPPLDEARMALLAGAGRMLLASMAVEEEKQPATETIAVGIQHVMEAMEDRVTEHPNIAAWMKIYGGSRAHFQRQFKLVTGRSPHDYFLRLKIQRACNYLVSSNMRIREISSRLGFTDPLYFSRLFHRITGQSARDYRTNGPQMGRPDDVGQTE